MADHLSFHIGLITSEVEVRRSSGVFNTDQVNLDRMLFPASGLMLADEKHYRDCLRLGVAVGVPVHMQHDMHRLIGWSRPLGLYADSEMVRVLGAIEEPETEEEKAELIARAAAYWEQHHIKGTEPYRDELIARISPSDLGSARFLQMEAAVVARSAIAAELYPDLFTPDSASADKDGLVDYHTLLRKMKLVQPGVFHDRERDLLLFAHRFFRRSFSHRNSLNAHFLQTFDAIALENCGLQVRLRLDPDLVGHPASARSIIELEHWRGPLFNDDIASIPKGVAEHKADDRTRLYEEVDRTQIWWKAPESRRVSDQNIDYRTFEIEELIENPSGGLDDNNFGCRYAHAEFSANDAAITHLDGAVRAYAWEPYLKRIETSIDRAGKHANYTKIFRFDGVLAIPIWKRLLSDFFRGNSLIPEYLGAPIQIDEQTKAGASANKLAPTEEAALAALICLAPGSLDGPTQLCAELCQQLSDQIIPYIEIGVGAVEKHFRERMDISNFTTVGFKDNILNLSRLCFGNSDDLKRDFDTEISTLAAALRQDVDSGLVHRASIPIAWENSGLLVMLTIAGDANKVATVLRQLPTVIDPKRAPSDWIEPLSDLIKATTPREQSPVMWDGVYRGVIAIGRTGVVEQQMLIPDALMKQLLSSGKLNITNAENADTSEMDGGTLA